MRQGLSALCTALLLCSSVSVAATEESSAVANQVAQAQLDIEQKQAKVAETGAELKEVQQALEAAKAEQTRLEEESVELESKRQRAKDKLDRDYARMLEEPDLDISASQRAFQQSWGELKQNQQARLESQHAIEEKKQALLSVQAKQKANVSELEAARDVHVRARVARLRDELSESTLSKVAFTNTCSATMTISECAKQSQTLAVQKAVSEFQDKLISATTESKQVKRHLNQASLNIHVLGQNAVEAKFYGDNKHRTVMDVQLESRPATNVPCRLLDVASHYCFAPNNANKNDSPSQEVQWVNLTIRSNQYDDQVIVDGVSYGSTPVDIMLPVGVHRITVSKEGYKSFHQDLTVRSDHNLRAVLREKSNLPTTGKTFADKLKDKSNAPTMVVIERGEYSVGDQGSIQTQISSAYAIGQTPVTVAQFGRFVEETTYQTEAEMNKSCLEQSTNSTQPMVNSNWRNPGFKQTADSPAVCISRTDAKAYANWLSAQTGYTYRLPTEYEWEVAARAGAKTAYWWGNEFGSSRANTGWGGTNWSNRSTSPVKSFSANGWGVFDTVGNVWEWTNSPAGVAKGGAWSFAPAKAQAHDSLFFNTNSGANFLGMRLVREIN